MSWIVCRFRLFCGHVPKRKPCQKCQLCQLYGAECASLTNPSCEFYAAFLANCYVPSGSVYIAGLKDDTSVPHLNIANAEYPAFKAVQRIPTQNSPPIYKYPHTIKPSLSYDNHINKQTVHLHLDQRSNIANILFKMMKLSVSQATMIVKKASTSSTTSAAQRTLSTAQECFSYYPIRKGIQRGPKKQTSSATGECFSYYPSRGPLVKPTSPNVVASLPLGQKQQKRRHPSKRPRHSDAASQQRWAADVAMINLFSNNHNESSSTM